VSENSEDAAVSENEVSIVRRASEILRLLIDSKTAGKDHMVVTDIMKKNGNHRR